MASKKEWKSPHLLVWEEPLHRLASPGKELGAWGKGRLELREKQFPDTRILTDPNILSSSAV